MASPDESHARTRLTAPPERVDSSARAAAEREPVRAWSPSARVAALAPWVAWAAMTAALSVFVFAHASRFPYADDIQIVALKWPGARADWPWLWSLHNDHRLPLTRVMVISALELGGGDFRAPIALHVALLALVSAAAIAAARRLRGRPSAADAFFPLLWMSWGNVENLLWSHQLQMTLTSSLAAAAALSLARPKIGRSWLALASACAVALPLCGGAGVAQAPFFAALLAWTGLERAREDRAATGIALLGAVGAGAVSALYFVGFEPSPLTAHPQSLTEFVQALVGIASVAFGALPSTGWTAVGGAVLALGLVALARELRGLRTDPTRRALAFALAAQFGLLAAMAWSRSDPQFHLRAFRYISLLYPLASVAYLSWARAPSRLRMTELALCAASLAALAGTWDIAYRTARNRAARDRVLMKALRSGASSTAMALESDRHFLHDPQVYARILATLRAHRMGPFREVTWSEDVDREWLESFPGLVTPPLMATPRERIFTRQFSGRRVLCGAPPAKIVYAGPAKPARLLGECGLRLAMNAQDRKELRADRDAEGGGVALVVEAIRSDGTREVLLRRELRAADTLPHRRLDLDLAVPGGRERIELRFEVLGSAPIDGALPYWDKLELR